MAARQTPWKPSQPATKSHADRALLAADAEADGGMVAVDVGHAHVVRLEDDLLAGGEARGDEILHHLVLAVDGDGAAAGELAQRDAVAHAVELQVEPGGRALRGPSARRRRRRAADRPWPARARRRAGGARRTRGRGARSRSTARPRTPAAARGSAPRGRRR